MEAAIEVSLERIREIIAGFGEKQFTTAEVIKKYSGTFCSNSGTPAYYSFNAQFGKLLKRFDNELHIREVEKNRPVPDDHGHVTSSSVWERMPHKG